jgi:hypothetical protein
MESANERKSVALTGCRKKEFPNQQDKVRNIFVLCLEVPGEGFLDVE